MMPEIYAFPHSIDQMTVNMGMTLRQYYAAEAMKGILSAASLPDVLTDNAVKQLTSAAFTLADAMIAEEYGS